jgi:hypothetical protein
MSNRPNKDVYLLAYGEISKELVVLGNVRNLRIFGLG